MPRVRTVDAKYVHRSEFVRAVRRATQDGAPAGTAIKMGMQTGQSRQVFDQRVLFKGSMKDCLMAGKQTKDAIRQSVARLRPTHDDVGGTARQAQSQYAKTKNQLTQHPVGSPQHTAALSAHREAKAQRYEAHKNYARSGGAKAQGALRSMGASHDASGYGISGVGAESWNEENGKRSSSGYKISSGDARRTIDRIITGDWTPGVWQKREQAMKARSVNNEAHAQRAAGQHTATPASVSKQRQQQGEHLRATGQPDRRPLVNR